MTQKLKTFNAEGDVPPELKPFYAANASGKWEPQFEGVDSISGLVAKRDELLGKVSGHASELTAKDGEISRLKSELTSANVVPRGYKAVPNADADLLEKVKAQGTADEVVAKLTEYPTLKTKVTTQERRTHLDAIRRAEGYGETAVDVLEMIQNFPEVELRDTAEKNADGTPKKQAIAKIKGADNVVTEKPLADYMAERHAALLPALKPGADVKRLPGGTSGASSGGGAASIVDDFIKQRDEAAASKPNPFSKKAVAA